MIQVNDFNEVRFTAGEVTALTIGNFDGCHLGHQELAQVTIAHAEALNQRGALPLALTFSPRPDAFFAANRARLCSSPRRKKPAAWANWA